MDCWPRRIPSGQREAERPRRRQRSPSEVGAWHPLLISDGPAAFVSSTEEGAYRAVLKRGENFARFREVFRERVEKIHEVAEIFVNFGIFSRRVGKIFRPLQKKSRPLRKKP